MADQNVVNLADHRDDPHMAGGAKCLACKHEWVAVAPAGVVDMECPECGCMRGVFVNSWGAPHDAIVFKCQCDSSAFEFVAHKNAKDYYLACIGCGKWHFLHDVRSDPVCAS